MQKLPSMILAGALPGGSGPRQRLGGGHHQLPAQHRPAGHVRHGRQRQGSRRLDRPGPSLLTLTGTFGGLLRQMWEWWLVSHHTRRLPEEAFCMCASSVKPSCCSWPLTPRRVLDMGSKQGTQQSSHMITVVAVVHGYCRTSPGGCRCMRPLRMLHRTSVC